MKKRISALILTVIVSLSATACKGARNPASSTPDTSSPVTESKAESVTESETASESDITPPEETAIESDPVTTPPPSTETPETTQIGESSDENTSEAPNEEKYTAGGIITEAMKQNSVLNEGNKVRLAEFLKKAQLGEDITVGFIGGAITEGTGAGNELCYARLTTDWIQSICPQSKVRYVNAGISNTGSYIGVHRVTEALLSKNPDLVFVEFSVDDTAENLERNIASYDSLLRTIWHYETKPAIITIATTEADGTSFQQHHADIIKTYDLPMISYADAILEVIKNGEILWSDISDDNVHPNTAGHSALSQMLCSYITKIAMELDSISGRESNFVAKATPAGFENGRLITSSNTVPAKNSGFVLKSGYFGGFDGVWSAVASFNSPYPEDVNLTFEVEAKTIGLLYGKLTTYAATTADIYIDDELVATVNSNFTDGLDNYVDCIHLKSFGETAKHTVKIVPKYKDGNTTFYVTGLAIS